MMCGKGRSSMQNLAVDACHRAPDSDGRRFDTLQIVSH